MLAVESSRLRRWYRPGLLLVVRGAGRAFSAWLDLDMWEQGVALDFFERQERVRTRLEALRAISIAAMHGHCLDGGSQLAIACDIRICSTECRLGLPSVLTSISCEGQG